MKEFSVVVAADEQRGIGRDGAMPWRLPREMAYFKTLTSTAAPGTQNAVIMGRRTYESIPEKFRPLVGRLNVALSRAPGYAPQGGLPAGSLDAALALVAARTDIDRVFVVGGGELYREALAHPACARVYRTLVHARFPADTWLADFESDYTRVSSDGPHEERDAAYTYEVWDRKR
jgi:dihydrofolate reductase